MPAVSGVVDRCATLMPQGARTRERHSPHCDETAPTPATPGLVCSTDERSCPPMPAAGPRSAARAVTRAPSSRSLHLVHRGSGPWLDRAGAADLVSCQRGLSVPMATVLLHADSEHVGWRRSRRYHALIRRLELGGISQELPRLLAPEPTREADDDALAGDTKQPRCRG
jgi:hypothetical protein